jgi:hypothetical protein
MSLCTHSKQIGNTRGAADVLLEDIRYLSSVLNSATIFEI